MVHYLVISVLYLCLWVHVAGWRLTGGLASPPVSRYRHLRAVSTTSMKALPVKAEITNGWNAENKEIFVSRYLQNQPVLIRNAFPDIQSAINLNFADYSELATDDDVETRIFVPHKEKYTEENGPFTLDYLTALHTSRNWSMLIQEVDRHIPHVADLWSEGFAFMPNWRRDDIMFSYSSPGGSIGAHVDNYDVFLLQGSGKRRWSIESKFITESEEKRRRVPRTSTRLLRDFVADEEWDLGPGDMLYLPPRIPHKGVTIGDTPGTTISVGFRAPNYKSVVTALWEEICSTCLPDEEAFYKDGADLTTVPLSPGSLSDRAIGSLNADIQRKFMSKLNDPAYFNAWLGRHLTEPLRYRQRGPSPFFLQPASSAGGSVASKEKEEGNIEGVEDNTGSVDEKEEGEQEEGQEMEEEGEDEEQSDDSTLPYAVRSRHRVAWTQHVFADAKAVLRAVLNDECALRRAEGLRAAYIGDTLYVDGEAFYDSRLDKETSIKLHRAFCDTNCISPTQLKSFIKSTDLDGPITPVISFFTKFLELGYFYPVSSNV